MNKLDLVIIGHLAYEKIKTPFGEKVVLGGAGHYSLIPASIFSKEVGIVSRVGGDYNLSFLKNLGIDLSGVKRIRTGKTARFRLEYSEDLVSRKVELEFNVLKEMSPKDIPNHFLSASYIHIATNTPQNQMKFLNFLKKRTKAKLSIDNLEQYIEKWPEEVIKALLLADLVFINEKEEKLLRSLRGKEKIIKRGPKGADYFKDGRVVSVPAPKVSHIVDSTGSGDVLAGVFLVLLSKGVDPERALKKAVQIASFSIIDFGVEHLLKSKAVK